MEASWLPGFRFFMVLTQLQRLSARLFSRLRFVCARIRPWIEDRPRLAAWFFTEDTADADYRRYNENMFSCLAEQERMLADRPRMAFYQALIARHIQPGHRVIDLGTGTGILGALAARQGAEHVYAIDHSDILIQARAVAEANRVENIEFVASHSTAFSTDVPVDVILHEQMGDCLFDEGMVANVTDLRDRLLKPGGLILPSLFDLYCEPVMLEESRFVPFIWNLNVHGYDYSCLESQRPRDPQYYRHTGSDREFVDHFLCEPAAVVSFDLHTINEAVFSRDITFRRKVAKAGRMDGYAIYFRARVDDDLVLTTDPLDPLRAPHWGYRILRTEREDYAVGEEIETRLAVDRWSDLDSWRWHSRKSARSESPIH